MYLHLGGETAVRKDDILAICDLDNASCSSITREFLRRAEKNGRVVNVSEDLPKSFIFCCENGGEETIYISQLNSATLLKRAEGAGWLE